VKILAVDTTSALGSVALVDGLVLLGEVLLTGADTHSVHVLPAIERLLAASGTDPLGVDAFAVAIGPGSFTGLRVGLSTVQGLALAAGRPCLGVSVLDVFAAAAGGTAVALRDAFRGEVYWAEYDASGRASAGPRVGPIDDVLRQVSGDASFVGDAVATHRAAITERFPEARFPSFPAFLASSLGLWAEPRLRSGLGSGPQELRPLYVRGADFRKASA
jgi:tRNA threonylcarbamoyladenosine biosynthesis protein TsaB